MHQHQADAAVMGGALDLGETVGRRRIDSGDEFEVEHQKPALRAALQQRLDVLVEPVGRAEEQVTLQVQALDFAAMRRQHRQIAARAIQRAAIFRAIEAVLDGIDSRCAQREGRAADHDTDQDAGDEAPLHDDDDDRQQRQIFDRRKPPPRLDDPSIELVRSEVDQQAAENEFRHIAEQHRRHRQHQRRDRRNGEAGQATGSAAIEVEHGTADRNAPGIAAERARQDVGDAGDVELALKVGFAMRRDFDARGVEQGA